MLKDQCNDEYLVHCAMKKERAADGTIEFVTEASKSHFIAEGARCLVWNVQGLAGSAAALPTVLTPPTAATPVAPQPAVQSVAVPMQATKGQPPFGAKFDPQTGQPLPKFDPMTGHQNW
jgi:hypothetical protein